MKNREEKGESKFSFPQPFFISNPKKIFNGEYRIIYVTPEYVSAATSTITEIVSKLPLACFAIDEAHCVSEWGHDFRHKYLALGKLKNISPSTPILALTGENLRLLFLGYRL